MTIFVFTLLCSLAAGKLLNTFGWETLNFLLLPWVLFLMVPLAGLAFHNKRVARMQYEKKRVSA